MAGKKCRKCGLVNWDDAGCCKRCGSLPPPPDYRPNRAQRPDPCDAPSVGTFNGVGVRLLGWKHSADGTATATTWFTVLFMPVFPLARYALVSPRAEDFEPAISVGQALQGLGQSMSLSTSYRFTHRLRLSGEEVLGTYLYAYAWVPLKLFVPLALIIGGVRAAFDFENDGSATPTVLTGSLLLAWMGYVMFVMARLLHRSRGGAG